MYAFRLNENHQVDRIKHKKGKTCLREGKTFRIFRGEIPKLKHDVVYVAPDIHKNREKLILTHFHALC